MYGVVELSLPSRSVPKLNPFCNNNEFMRLCFGPENKYSACGSDKAQGIYIVSISSSSVSFPHCLVIWTMNCYLIFIFPVYIFHDRAASKNCKFPGWWDQVLKLWFKRWNHFGLTYSAFCSCSVWWVWRFVFATEFNIFFETCLKVSASLLLQLSIRY
jgi:hypothetical protein